MYNRKVYADTKQQTGAKTMGTYSVTITRETSPPNSGSPSGECWVARDASGDWRNYCDLSFAGTAAEAVGKMFHADETGGIEDMGDTAMAEILT